MYYNKDDYKVGRQCAVHLLLTIVAAPSIFNVQSVQLHIIVT